MISSLISLSHTFVTRYHHHHMGSQSVSNLPSPGLDCVMSITPVLPRFSGSHGTWDSSHQPASNPQHTQNFHIFILWKEIGKFLTWGRQMSLAWLFFDQENFKPPKSLQKKKKICYKRLFKHDFKSQTCYQVLFEFLWCISEWRPRTFDKKLGQ